MRTKKRKAKHAPDESYGKKWLTYYGFNFMDPDGKIMRKGQLFSLSGEFTLIPYTPTSGWTETECNEHFKRVQMIRHHNHIPELQAYSKVKL